MYKSLCVRQCLHLLLNLQSFQDVEFDLVVLGGGVKKKKHAEKNRSTRFSNYANVEQKNGSQFSGFIYKRCYIKLNDNRIKLTSIASTNQFEPRCIHECLVYFHIESLVTKEVPRVRVPFFHIEKIPYLQVLMSREKSRVST